MVSIHPSPWQRVSRQAASLLARPSRGYRWANTLGIILPFVFKKFELSSYRDGTVWAAFEATPRKIVPPGASWPVDKEPDWNRESKQCQVKQENADPAAPHFQNGKYMNARQEAQGAANLQRLKKENNAVSPTGWGSHTVITNLPKKPDRKHAGQ